MAPAAETRTFQAEARELLGLMIHSLYSHREIFLRELISNASDALDRLRYEALRRPELAPEGSEAFAIRIELDRERRVLAVADDGIGMSRQEVVENLGTIARSGTRAFRDAARAAEGESSSLPTTIGQFGVGFYSCFMVAKEVVVETARAGETVGTRFTSRGDGEYTVEDAAAATRGTRVELSLEPVEVEGEAPQDFADPATIRALVRKYSDFVEWPIVMDARHFAGDGTLRRRTLGGAEFVVLNSQRPLWSRPKDEITPAEHAQFFRHLTHAFSDPLETVHFKAEGGTEYTALVYVPSERPFDLFDPAHARSHVALYVRHVFVTANCEELVPSYLRFLRGVVDSADLPLNVSREILQQNRLLPQISRRLVKKVLDALAAMLAQRRADYVRFWRAFGNVLAEGIVLDAEHSGAVAALALFPSSRDGELSTLGEYVARMPASQREIYVLVGRDLAVARRSPHLEALAARGCEALLAVEPIDQWVFERVREFESKPIVRLERGELDLGDAAEREQREAEERECRSLLEGIEAVLSPAVARVKLSARLVESPAVLVDDPHAVGPHVERWLRETGGEVPPRRRTLELNARHPLFARLKALHARDESSARLRDLVELVHAQALIAEGSAPADPARFARLFGDLLARAAE
jgi:molecular chaperone HtpG